MTGTAHDERGGGLSVETMLLTPIMLVLVAFVVIAAQVALTQDAVTNAAGAAARAATQERSADAAQSAAEQVAASTLSGTALVECTNPVVDVDTSGFAIPVGTPAQVTTRVSCTATRSYLELLHGGSATYSGDGSAPLDTYRER